MSPATRRWTFGAILMASGCFADPVTVPPALGEDPSTGPSTTSAMAEGPTTVAPTSGDPSGTDDSDDDAAGDSGDSGDSGDESTSTGAGDTAATFGSEASSGDTTTHGPGTGGTSTGDPSGTTTGEATTTGASAWTCSGAYYGTNDGCDCGCGIPDPDCLDSTVSACDYCAQAGSCSGSVCPGQIDPNDNAVCDG